MLFKENITTKEQMGEELETILDFVFDLLRDYGLDDFYIEISTKPDTMTTTFLSIPTQSGTCAWKSVRAKVRWPIPAKMSPIPRTTRATERARSDRAMVIARAGCRRRWCGAADTMTPVSPNFRRPVDAAPRSLG